MNLQKCKNGHFYDGDMYSSCPHCAGQGAEPNKTVALVMPEDDSEGATIAIGADGKPVNESPGGHMIVEDDNQTMGIFMDERMENESKEPVVGWLVCTGGRFFGQDFKLKSGRNFIGRGRNMDICLEGELSVSRERHAAVIYEPRQNIFLVQPGESKELFYLDDEVVLSAKEIRKNSVLQVGDVTLMFVPCCDNVFQWEGSKNNK